MGAVAGAEPPVVLAGAGDGHAAEMCANAEHNQPVEGMVQDGKWLINNWIKNSCENISCVYNILAQQIIYNVNQPKRIQTNEPFLQK